MLFNWFLLRCYTFVFCQTAETIHCMAERLRVSGLNLDSLEQINRHAQCLRRVFVCARLMRAWCWEWNITREREKRRREKIGLFLDDFFFLLLSFHSKKAAVPKFHCMTDHFLFLTNFISLQWWPFVCASLCGAHKMRIFGISQKKRIPSCEWKTAANL